MTDADRLARNVTQLDTCHPAFRVRLERVLAGLESFGYRPRIQQAWRAPAEQRALRRAGTSKLSWGYHNCTAADGSPESLAADVLDDDAPRAPSKVYLVRLGALARQHGLSTGNDWGLPPVLKRAVRQAEQTDIVPDDLKLSWDPTHVEWAGLTVAQARAGMRPIVEDLRA